MPEIDLPPLGVAGDPAPGSRSEPSSGGLGAKSCVHVCVCVLVCVLVRVPVRVRMPLPAIAGDCDCKCETPWLGNQPCCIG